jgi:hypothetical protein
MIVMFIHIYATSWVTSLSAQTVILSTAEALKIGLSLVMYYTKGVSLFRSVSESVTTYFWKRDVQQQRVISAVGF